MASAGILLRSLSPSKPGTKSSMASRAHLKRPWLRVLHLLMRASSHLSFICSSFANFCCCFTISLLRLWITFKFSSTIYFNFFDVFSRTLSTQLVRSTCSWVVLPLADLSSVSWSVSYLASSKISF